MEISCGIFPLQQTEQGIQILLIQHTQGGHWAFPKGRADGQESFLETAIRELKEETHLDVYRFLTDAPFSEHYEFYRANQRISKIVYYFPALVTGSLKLQAEEVCAAKWLPLEEAASWLTFQKTQLTYLEAIQSIQMDVFL